MAGSGTGPPPRPVAKARPPFRRRTPRRRPVARPCSPPAEHMHVSSHHIISSHHITSHHLIISSHHITSSHHINGAHARLLTALRPSVRSSHEVTRIGAWVWESRRFPRDSDARAVERFSGWCSSGLRAAELRSCVCRPLERLGRLALRGWRKAPRPHRSPKSGSEIPDCPGRESRMSRMKPGFFSIRASSTNQNPGLTEILINPGRIQDVSRTNPGRTQDEYPDFRRAGLQKAVRARRGRRADRAFAAC